MILKAEPDVDIVGEASDGAEAVLSARELEPDVVLMDIRMPGMDGIEATRRITADLRSRVVVLTTFDLDQYVYDSLRAGASAFLLKDAPEQQLVAAVRVVADGGSLFAPSVTRRLIERFAETQTSEAKPPAGLTVRELEVLHLVARGDSNAEIAAELVVSEHTAQNARREHPPEARVTKSRPGRRPCVRDRARTPEQPITAHSRMTPSTSSRFASINSCESASRFSRSSGSVFDGRTLKCQSSA